MVAVIIPPRPATTRAKSARRPTGLHAPPAHATLHGGQWAPPTPSQSFRFTRPRLPPKPRTAGTRPRPPPGGPRGRTDGPSPRSTDAALPRYRCSFVADRGNLSWRLTPKIGPDGGPAPVRRPRVLTDSPSTRSSVGDSESESAQSRPSLAAAPRASARQRRRDTMADLARAVAALRRGELCHSAPSNPAPPVYFSLIEECSPTRRDSHVPGRAPVNEEAEQPDAVSSPRSMAVALSTARARASPLLRQWAPSMPRGECGARPQSARPSHCESTAGTPQPRPHTARPSAARDDPAAPSNGPLTVVWTPRSGEGSDPSGLQLLAALRRSAPPRPPPPPVKPLSPRPAAVPCGSGSLAPPAAGARRTSVVMLSTPAESPHGPPGPRRRFSGLDSGPPAPLAAPVTCDQPPRTQPENAHPGCLRGMRFSAVLQVEPPPFGSLADPALDGNISDPAPVQHQDSEVFQLMDAHRSASAEVSPASAERPRARRVPPRPGWGMNYTDDYSRAVHTEQLLQAAQRLPASAAAVHSAFPSHFMHNAKERERRRQLQLDQQRAQELASAPGGEMGDGHSPTKRRQSRRQSRRESARSGRT
eukprot:TRINITY_DN37042_c1_g1_i3.p1 TRINITY_DN37042_c1_g1~~TRINITY_DN37042_c1_g1_i3.p1  ORF type:complete len:590 (+),score=77.20 TRINITY_DN37042_c1_g1_i3:87-1856(+)